MKNCCVPGCMDRVSQRHRFPKGNPTLFKTWLKVINPQNWKELSDEQIYNRYYVCHAHFPENYHLPGCRRGLTIDAVPTIGVPGSSFETDLLAKKPKLAGVITVVDMEKLLEKKPFEAGPSGIEKSIPEDGPNDDDMEVNTQDPLSNSVMNKEKIKKGFRKSILTRLQYSSITQLTVKERIMYSMLKKYNARISQLKYQNKRLRQRLAYAKKGITLKR